MLKHWWAILLILVVITTWLGKNVEDELTPLAEDNIETPDYTLKTFNTTRMDEFGKLKSQLTADDMIHYPNINTSITKPIVVFYRDTHPFWTAQSETGEVSPEADQVWLLGEVTLEQHTQKPIKIMSRDLWVRIDTEYAHTDAPTTIISGFGETKSNGMRIFMPIEQIELFSQVRGRYVLK